MDISHTDENMTVMVGQIRDTVIRLDARFIAIEESQELLRVRAHDISNRVQIHDLELLKVQHAIEMNGMQMTQMTVTIEAGFKEAAGISLPAEVRSFLIAEYENRRAGDQGWSSNKWIVVATLLLVLVAIAGQFYTAIHG